MTTVDQAFDTALASLRDRYVSGLAGTISELKKFAVLCEFEETSADMASAIGQMAHRLSGTGKTLGFEGISAAAGNLELVLQSNACSADASAAARALARACEAARDLPGDTADIEYAAASTESAHASAELPPQLPHFLAVHKDPSLAKLLADVCDNRASLSDFSACTDATKFLGDHHADLVLLDLDCPGCSPEGIAALHAKTRAMNIPVLAVAAHRRAAAVLHALSDGQITCFLKPVEAAMLHEKLFETLGRQRLVAIVCDDDPVTREFLKPRFEARGFEVVLAKDGEELLELAARVRPSIILLDRVMPGMDGLDVLRTLKSQSATHNIPVIVLTAKRQPQDVSLGLRSGAAAYMAKPFSPDQVLSKSLEILNAPKARRA